MGGPAGLLLTSLACLTHVTASLPAPGPCEQRVAQLEAELQDQHHYIQNLQNRLELRLENLPNRHLGPDDPYRDCSEVFAGGNVASGRYVVRPSGAPTAFSVFCDMSSGGGWTVFQRRSDGHEDFDRAWVDYKKGFGDHFSPNGEFWLGNDLLHYLTSQGDYELRVNLEDFEGKQRFAEYKKFRVDREEDQYQLHLGEYSAGDAGDTLGGATGSSGVKFRTFDRPHDPHDPRDPRDPRNPHDPRDPNQQSDEAQLVAEGDDEGDAECIRHDRSGWWFSRCESGNPNGHYYLGPYEALAEDGVVWYTWHGWWYSIKSVVMMVRAIDLQAPPPGHASPPPPPPPWQQQQQQGLDNHVEEPW